MRVRYTNLDLLKIVAAVLIVFHHYQQSFPVTFDGVNFYGGSIYFGRLVELFFIISGFLTANTDRASDRRYLSSFLKKYCRLLPSVMLSVTAGLGIAYAHYALIGSWLSNRQYSITNIITSYLLLFKGWFWKISIGVNNPTWYLCILLLCYLLFYAIKAVGQQRRWVRTALSLLVAVGAFVLLVNKSTANTMFLTTSNLRGYLSFFVGVCLYELVRMLNEQHRRVAPLVIAAALFACWLGSLTHHKPDSLLVTSTTLFPAVVLLAVSLPQISWKPLSFWGAVSFEVYLWHVPIFRAIKLTLALTGWTMSESFWMMVLVTLAAELVGALVYRFFEVPVQHFLQQKLPIFRKPTT